MLSGDATHQHNAALPFNNLHLNLKEQTQGKQDSDQPKMIGKAGHFSEFQPI
jgi:hypothetical protein